MAESSFYQFISPTLLSALFTVAATCLRKVKILVDNDPKIRFFLHWLEHLMMQLIHLPTDVRFQDGALCICEHLKADAMHTSNLQLEASLAAQQVLLRFWGSL